MLFSGYLELRTMDKVHKPSDYECYIHHRHNTLQSTIIILFKRDVKNVNYISKVDSRAQGITKSHSFDISLITWNILTI
jgi:hypothetical protein